MTRFILPHKKLTKQKIIEKKKRMFGFKRRGTEREDICPEVPIKPETEGNEIAIVACG